MAALTGLYFPPKYVQVVVRVLKFATFTGWPVTEGITKGELRVKKKGLKLPQRSGKDREENRVKIPVFKNRYFYAYRLGSVQERA
jgi:hypothetical protein